MIKKPFGPRSIASKVWYASVSPFAMGLVAFSFVMVAFGSTIYITSVPGMVINDTPYVDPIIDASDSGASEEGDGATDGSSTSGSSGSLLAESIESLTSGYIDGSSSLGSAAVSIMRSGLTVPVLNFNGSSSGTGEEGDTSSGGSDIVDNGGVVPPIDPSIPIEPDKPPELTEEEKQELMFHDALVNAYNALPALYEQVTASFVNFNALHPTPDSTLDTTTKNTYFNEANSLWNALNCAYNENTYVEGKGNINVPTTSRYYQNSVEIKALYDDLVKAQLAVKNAWFKDKLNQKYDKYMEHIIKECPNGQSTHLLDFVAKYPGAAL